MAKIVFRSPAKAVAKVVGTTLNKRIVSASQPPGAKMTPTVAEAPGAPILFSASAVVPSSGEQSIRNKALVNYLDVPVEIHEIRFALRCASSAFGDLDQTDAGGITAVQITAGSAAVPLTNGYVPIWSLAKAKREAESLFRSFPSSVNSTFSTYVWRPSRPFYVPPKTPFNVQFKHLGLVKYDVSATIALAGRRVAPRGRLSSVPYAAAYVSKAFDFSTAGETDMAIETALVNTTGRVLNVDRLLGRVGVFHSDEPGAPPLKPVFRDFYEADFAGNSLTLRMSAGRNRPVVRDYTPFRAVFGHDGQIDVPHTLGVGEHYSVELRKAALTAPASAYEYFQAQAFVSLLGWREVTL